MRCARKLCLVTLAGGMGAASSGSVKCAGYVSIRVNVGCFGETQARGLGPRRSVGSVQDKRYRAWEHLVIVIYLLAIDVHFQKHSVAGLPIHS